MRENCTSGTVRGASGNRRPYRRGSEHHGFTVDPEVYFASMEQLAWHVERPFNKGAATMYLLYERLRQYATVVLRGEGADELLAGYVGSRGLGLDKVLRHGAVKMALTFSTVALIHQLFWNGLHDRPLADALETYCRLMFGVR